MKPPTVSAELVRGDADLMKFAEELQEVGNRLARVEIGDVKRGEGSARGLSWRCRLIANANLMRGQEILRFAVLALNEGAFVVAKVLTRALDETLAAVVFARRSIERAVKNGNPEELGEVLARLTVGNRYMSERVADEYPKSYNVLNMIDETGRYLAELAPEAGGKRSAFREDYEFISEFVHPSGGSYAAYMQQVGERIVFRRSGPTLHAEVGSMLATLTMCAHFLLEEATALAGVADLPANWPGPPAAH